MSKLNYLSDLIFGPDGAVQFLEDEKPFLSGADQFIFIFGGSIMLLVTLFLVIGSLRFRELRKQPGDLIVGVALSDLTLAIHWIVLAIWSHKVDDPTFCGSVGALGIFGASGELFYNVGFNIFLIVSLRNALKQAKIPKKSFHIIILGISFAFLIFVAVTDKIGRTSIGTCSIKSGAASEENKPFSMYLSVLIVGMYSILGLFTYSYIRKNAPKCAQAHAKRTKFLLYYSRYIMASTALYGLIAFTNFWAIYSTSQWLWSFYNVVKLLSPMVLTFIRYNDPFLKRIMMASLMPWKKDLMKPQTAPLLMHSNTVYGEGRGSLIESKPIRDPESHEHDQEFMFNTLSGDRRVELVYTLLTCAMYSEVSQRNGVEKSQHNAFDKNAKNMFKHERLCEMGQECINSLPTILKQELDKNKFEILPGTLKTYAPEVFMSMINEDKEYLNILESLDFKFNREQIRDASGPGGGKSGEFFFFSRDKKLIIKTIPDLELKMLIKILEQYQDHFKQNPNTLIAKIYGAMTFESTELGQKFNIIIMKNLSGYQSKYVKRSYDMKGSTYDREVVKDPSKYDEAELCKLVLKDYDFVKFEKKFNIPREFTDLFIKQVEADANFFRRVNLIDYSMMVFCINKAHFLQSGHFIKDEFVTKNPIGALENTENPGMFYHIGIVDYLQPYTMGKRMERVMKKMTKCNLQLDTSSQNPEVYADRFINFVKRLV